LLVFCGSSLEQSRISDGVDRSNDRLYHDKSLVELDVRSGTNLWELSLYYCPKAYPLDHTSIQRAAHSDDNPAIYYRMADGCSLCINKLAFLVVAEFQ
jgi:hypothetical protein